MATHAGRSVCDGLRKDQDFQAARTLLSSLTVVDLGGEEIALKAARNFWILRRCGVTVRKTIDTIIATRCIESDNDLLNNDRDLDAFAAHPGLRLAG
jgi:hypothetical protein